MNHDTFVSDDGGSVDANFAAIVAFIAGCAANGVSSSAVSTARSKHEIARKRSIHAGGVAWLRTEPATWRPSTIDLCQTIAERCVSESAIDGDDVFEEP